MVPTMLTLLFLLYLQNKKTISMKQSFLFLSIFLILCFLTTDILLVILWIVCPLLLYEIYCLLKNQKYHKYVVECFAVGIILVGIYYVLYNLDVLRFMDKIYGVSSYYLSWVSIPMIWSKGIEFLLQAIVHAMNIDVSGAIIQPMSVVWMSKIIIVIVAFVNLFFYIKLCIQKEKEWFVAIVSGAIILSMLAFLFNGQRITLYEKYGYYYAYSGYMGIVWPLLVFLATDFFRNVSKREGAKGLQIVLALGGLCFSMILCMEVGQFCRSDYKNIDQQAAEYLTERGNEAGMAIKDASYPVTAWSKGEFFSMPYVAVTEEGKLGYRQYDTVLEYVSGDIAIRDQQVANMDKAIISKYGDYEESIYFFEDDRTAFSDAAGGRAVYSFDRDIRWPVRNYDLSNYVGEPIKIFLPLGETRVSIYGSDLEETEIILDPENKRELSMRCETSDKDKKTYIVYCPYNMMGDIIVQKHGDANKPVYDSLKVEMVRAAICIKENLTIKTQEKTSISKEIKKGEYVFILNGENLGEIELTAQNDDDEIILQQDGRGRKIFQATFVEENPTLFIRNLGNDDITLNSIYYELTILDREMTIERLN